jgi:hypothetical protein
MKIIDCSPQNSEKNGIQDLARRAQDLLPIHLSKNPIRVAEEVVIELLKRNTTSKYLLLRNIVIEPLNEPVPMLLIGPTGVWVIAATDIKGVYKAQDEHWYELKGKERKYHPSRPNLVFTTYQMERNIIRKMRLAGVTDIDVKGVLIFTNPGTHVESVRPSIRIILADGLKRFTANINQNPIMMTNQELEQLKNLFVHQEPTGEEQAESDLRDQFDFIEDAPSKKPIRMPAAPTTAPFAYLTSRINLSRGQWIFLGILAVFQILLLIGIIVLFMM